MGGNSLAQDSRFLNVLLRGREVTCGRYGRWTIAGHIDEVVRAWKSVGVDYSEDFIQNIPSVGGSSFGGTVKTHYYIDGKSVSRYDAWVHAEKVVGKHLKRADWD